MTEKRFSLDMDTEWWFIDDNTIQVNEFGYRDDLTGEDKYRGLKQTLTEKETVDLLNKLHEENEQLNKENKNLKGIIQKLMINQMTITPEDMHNNQRITEITNYALVEFIKSKGYTFEEVSQFVTEEL